MLVVDASVLVHACLAQEGLDPLQHEELVGPPLLWSETGSVLHEMLWRGEISKDLAAIANDRFARAFLRRRGPRGLHRKAWRIADAFGWAKTYDAEYVGLAQILKCPLLTIDARLRATAARVIDVVGPADL